MPLALRSLRAVEIEFRGIPPTAEITDPEHYRIKALVALNYAGSLGRLLSFVSVKKILDNKFEDDDLEALLEELDDAMFTVGELQHALCDDAYLAVEEMRDLYRKGEETVVESAA